MSPRSKEERRDDSFSRLYRMAFGEKKTQTNREFDPYKGNMENRDHFANFLNAILAGQQKSINFLRQMSESRKKELKEIHANSGLALQVLDSF